MIVEELLQQLWDRNGRLVSEYRWPRPIPASADPRNPRDITAGDGGATGRGFELRSVQTGATSHIRSILFPSLVLCLTLSQPHQHPALCQVGGWLGPLRAFESPPSVAWTSSESSNKLVQHSACWIFWSLGQKSCRTKFPWISLWIFRGFLCFASWEEEIKNPGHFSMQNS